MKETDIALKKIAKGAGILSIGLLISKILSYLYRIIIARVNVEQYGLFSISLAIFNFLVVLALLGIGEGVVRFVSFHKGELNNRKIKGVITSALKITSISSLICGMFLFFASDWIAVTFFHSPNLSILFKIFAFGIPLDSLRTVCFSTTEAFQQVKYEIYAKNVGENITKIMLTFLLVYLGFGVVGASIAYIASIFFSFVLSLYFVESKIFSVFRTKIIPVKSDKLLLDYSLPLLFTGFIYLIIQWTDTLMIGYFKTPTQVGVYNVAFPTTAMLWLLSSAIRALFFPILSELYARNKIGTFKSVYRTVTKWIWMIDLIIFIGLVSFSKQIIYFLFGKAYLTSQFSFFGHTFAISVLALIILSSSVLICDLLSPAKDVLLVFKETRFIFLITIIGAVFNIVLNFILIPKYSAIGAALASGLAYLIIFVVIGIKAYKITKVNPVNKNCLKIVSSSVLILVIILTLKLYMVQSILWVLIIGLVLFLLYSSLLVLTKTFEREDLLIINAIKQKLGLKINLNKIIGKFV